jgi:hypothetical protein
MITFGICCLILAAAVSSVCFIFACADLLEKMIEQMKRRNDLYEESLRQGRVDKD